MKARSNILIAGCMAATFVAAVLDGVYRRGTDGVPVEEKTRKGIQSTLSW